MSLISSSFWLACAVCFGDPASRENQAIFWGMMILVGAIGSILAAIITLAVKWYRRSEQL